MSMELRMLLAVVLSFGVFFLYHVFFMKKAPLENKEPTQIAERVEKEIPATVEGVRALDERPLQPEVAVPSPARQGRTITVSTPLYLAELTENGAALKSFKLKEYKETSAPGAPMKELVELSGEHKWTLGVSFLRESMNGLKQAVFDAATEASLMNVTERSEGLIFTWTSPDGVTIIKTYTFSPGTYEIGLEIKVRNLSSETIGRNLTVSLKKSLKGATESRYVFSGPAALINGELEEIKIKEIAKQDKYVGHIGWIACESQYFVSAIIPQKAEEATMRLAVSDGEVLETTYIDPSGPVPPRTERTYQYTVYFGPKSLEALGSVGADLAKIVDFGFFDIIAKPLLHAMNFIHRYISNYGIVIIIITIFVKILFWPLSNRSYKSMSQMKKLQPKLAEIRAKYKHDKKMMNQEMMSLYKLYKINPLGGCLPMVLQIPVFFAFYKMLYQAIELRHAPFFLWINDLSAPDRLFSLNFKIPLMAAPYGIPVLTIIMGASMFLQQKMSPPPGDPTQAKMMMFMPIFFTFIFINFPSGLVLYWLVNNILSMVQQHYVTKKTA
ncbi:MAG: membrane protein insertase YidC, partial [Deltaproteobacteria bacterium]|nr:membrane protein insertase YidC [Deltaproteobacteria bacterium]MBW1794876.1 membrane protein insertase YidC [Deltaproteobacteria bacterium]MBW2329535.1 membrane protein insertase YidC [Deltaproteobacteria bacterium]